LSILLLSPTLEVPTRRSVTGHDRTVLVGKLVKFLATTVMDRLDDIAGLASDLPEISEMSAFPADRPEWSGIGEVRLTGVRGVDLMIELSRIAGSQMRQKGKAGHRGLPRRVSRCGAAGAGLRAS